MLKFEFELDLNTKELSSGLKAGLNASVAATAAKLKQRGQEIASKKLKSGLKHWNKGFSVDKVSDGFWIITMEGKLANMMEDGFGTGEIKRMILNGNRAKHNAKTGKKYVDVPISLDADAVSGKIGKTNIQVSQFKDADALVKAVQMSDWKNKGIRTEKRITKRVEDIIQSKKPKSKGNPQYLTIRRVSESSQGWPVNPFKGAKVFEELDNYLEQAFEESLEMLL